MKIRFSDDAAAAYAEALAYIYQHNRLAAQHFAARVDKALRRIQTFPRSGHYVPEYPALPLRQFVVEPYRFFYQIDERHRQIIIHDVWHGAPLPAQPDLPAP
jgi:plasmid stabilization system protein ParE